MRAPAWIQHKTPPHHDWPFVSYHKIAFIILLIQRYPRMAYLAQSTIICWTRTPGSNWGHTKLYSLPRTSTPRNEYRYYSWRWKIIESVLQCCQSLTRMITPRLNTAPSLVPSVGQHCQGPITLMRIHKGDVLSPEIMPQQLWQRPRTMHILICQDSSSDMTKHPNQSTNVFSLYSPIIN